MSEEGELKKRFIDWWTEDNTVYGSNTLFIKTIDNIVDEAKKEFPQLIYTDDDSENLQQVIDIASWFLKYFGIKTKK